MRTILKTEVELNFAVLYNAENLKKAHHTGGKSSLFIFSKYSKHVSSANFFKSLLKMSAGLAGSNAAKQIHNYVCWNRIGKT